MPQSLPASPRLYPSSTKANAKSAALRRHHCCAPLPRAAPLPCDAADRAFRQYDAADPANRLVAGELEARWNKGLAHVAEIDGKIAAHDAALPTAVVDPAALGMLASDLKTVWSAPTTDARLFLIFSIRNALA
jgi:hypothetical protein